MKIEFTYDMIFGFPGPNLCLLGNETDFQMLGKAIVDLTSANSEGKISITDLEFMQLSGEKVKVIFASKPEANLFGKLINNGEVLLFELDDRYWERLFVFFALMSWDKKTYYLNSFEDALKDLDLDQDCHFICSSEF